MRDVPTPLYDDRCCVCTTIANVVRRFSRFGIRAIGHYSGEGRILKHWIFGPRDEPEQMFWLVAGDKLTEVGVA